jgi:hypothetical protein
MTRTAEPEEEELRQLTIERAYWYDSPQRPAGVSMSLDDRTTAGHVLVHVREGRAEEGKSQYQDFYDRVAKDFVLRAGGHDDVPLHATRGYFVNPERGIQEFYLRIEPAPLERMARDLPYTLIASNNDSGMRWVVAEGVTLTRGNEATPSEVQELTIDSVLWTDRDGSPVQGMPELAGRLLLHVGRSERFPEHKAFTAACDRFFYLEAPGLPAIEATTGVGGVTTSEQSWVLLESISDGALPLQRGVAYTLRPRNQEPRYQWRVASAVTVAR